MTTYEDKLELAKRHQRRVFDSWDPPDWATLAMFGFYALEAAVEAAALHERLDVPKAHWARVDAARTLHAQVGLPDVSDLLRDLNEVRKSEAYGDVAAPRLDAEEVVSSIETYIDAVDGLVGGRGS